MGQVVIAIALLFAISVAISMAGGLVIRRLVGDGKRPAIHVIVPVLIFIGLWLSFFVGVWFYDYWLPDYGFGVTPSEANAVGLVRAIGVPVTAEDVDYRVCPAAGALVVLDFQIEEKDFLAWMSAKGWHPRKFAPGEDAMNVWEDSELPFPKFAPAHSPIAVTPVRSYFNGTDQQIEVWRGYYFDNYDPEDDYDDSGDTVVYDLKTGRAYLTRTTY